MISLLGAIFSDKEEKPVIHDDSRLIVPGSLFLLHDNNQEFLNPAIKAGAGILVYSSKHKNFVNKLTLKTTTIKQIEDIEKTANNSLGLIEIPDENFNIANILKAYYDTKNVTFIAITGTNGKTSTTAFTRQILNRNGHKCASIECGRIVIDENIEIQLGHGLTTPSIFDIHKAQYIVQKKYDAKFLVVEASSHGIHQGRMMGVNIKLAAFTNLSPDHLDYHQNMRSYFDAKKILFTKHLEVGGTAVLNADTSEFEELMRAIKDRSITILSYGKQGSDLKLKSSFVHGNTQTIEVENDGKVFTSEINFPGTFQVANILCSLGICMALGFKIEELIKTVKQLTPPKGRMENVCHYSEDHSGVYVDYAHTPNALEKALQSCKEQLKHNGKLTVVFGCGGERDISKRAIMGRIASELSDCVIITDDNPRNEDSLQIRKQIISGVEAGLLHKIIEVADDRKLAIEKAIELSNKNDIVLIAGKGHETFQIVGTKRIPLHDIKIAQDALSRKHQAQNEDRESIIHDAIV